MCCEWTGMMNSLEQKRCEKIQRKKRQNMKWSMNMGEEGCFGKTEKYGGIQCTTLAYNHFIFPSSLLPLISFVQNFLLFPYDFHTVSHSEKEGEGDDKEREREEKKKTSEIFKQNTLIKCQPVIKGGPCCSANLPKVGLLVSFISNPIVSYCFLGGYKEVWHLWAFLME